MTIPLRIALWGSLAILVPAAGSLVVVLILGRALPWQFELPAVSLHVGAALIALALGAAQLWLPKRAPRHHLIGYLWCGLLAMVAVSGLGVQLDPKGGVTFIHRVSSYFSIATLVLLPIVIHAGRTGRRKAHRNALLGVFALLLLAGGMSFIPGRAVGDLVSQAWR
jgi:uncharacterized membrane protein